MAKKYQPPKPRKPARKPKAAKPVTRWMHKSAKYGLVGETHSSEERCEYYVPIVDAKPVMDAKPVRVKIVEVRQ